MVAAISESFGVSTSREIAPESLFAAISEPFGVSTSLEIALERRHGASSATFLSDEAAWTELLTCTPLGFAHARQW